VAVAFNNTPFIRNRFFEQEFYDLARVEVLRGPQGTLYGRNATAGVVNIISQKPKFAYEAKLSADVSNYSSSRLEGMINLPLVDDKVALRLAGAWTKRAGYSTNQITGNQIDGRDLWSTRLSLRFTPTDKLEANLIWEHFQEDDDRIRSGKQLCHRDARTTLGEGSNVGVLSFTYGGYGEGAVGGLVNQGCLAASLYSPDSFEAPNGFSLPYYHPLGAIFLPTVRDFDPYVSTTQSRDLRVIESTVDPHYLAGTDTAELQFTYDFANGMSLTSETGYLSDELFSTQDYNRFNTAPGAFDVSRLDARWRQGILDENGTFCDPQIGCANRLVAVDLSTAKSRQFSQEFRLGSNFDAPLNFSLGGNFLRYDTEDKYYVFINTLTLYSAISPYGRGINLPPWQANVSDNRECLQKGMVEPDPTQFQSVGGCEYIDPNPIGSLNDLGHNYFLSKNPYKLISYAVFGEAYYNITPALKLTVGLRWTVDKKEAPRIPSWILSANNVGYPVAEVIRQEWREPTGRMTLDWKPDLSFTDESLFYASYAHGYKAGGANPPAAGVVSYAGGAAAEGLVAQSATQPKTFEPEFVNAFEVGSKNTLLDGRMTLNLGAFYYDYSGYQISYIVNRSAVNLNFDAKVWGAELEADWRPLENLRLGLKLGYEDTNVAKGEKAIDVMDRTAGNPDWFVTRPFPTFPSNCILPLTVVNGNYFNTPGQLVMPGNTNVNGNVGLCEYAYVLNLDPVTQMPYVPNPTQIAPLGPGSDPITVDLHGYPGFNPLDESQGHNHGEGFYKDLSGHALPNAPHYTVTVTADYTLPLPSDWLMTLHTDLYYQSEAWTRIFNDPGYDKLKAYTNVNLAAIFANEDAGWKVMAYVKNVFDRDSITGAFLNSDDTGLTTNVFLTEPRLYGLRITKEWNGGPWWTGVGSNHSGPYPLTVEIAGQVQRDDASHEPTAPSFIGGFSGGLDTTAAIQNRDLDWGDGRALKLVWRPGGGPWNVSGSVRFGRANGGAARAHSEKLTDKVCLFGGKYASLCAPDFLGGAYYDQFHYAKTDFSDISVNNREKHTLVDFMVGRDVGLGRPADLKSSAGLGLRYAQFTSTTDMEMRGLPDWYLPTGGLFKYQSHYHVYKANIQARRSFDGLGPVVSWDGAQRLVGNQDVGSVDLDASITAGVLFGRQKTSLRGTETSIYYTGTFKYPGPQRSDPVISSPSLAPRSKSVAVPLVDLSLGLSYEIQRVKVGAGYRWERYYNVLDAGHAEHRAYDRTFDGPYFKIAVGFGG
jgi:outer membrane receptor protein involved in Fe transport